MNQPSVRRIVSTFAIVGVVLVAASPAEAQTPPDNTKVNQRDRAKDQ